MARIAYKQGLHKSNRTLSSNHRKRKSSRKHWGYRQNSIKRLPGKSFDFLNDASATNHYAFNAFNTAFGSFATTLSKTRAGP